MSLESWALSLPSASIRGKSPPNPCWSHVYPHHPCHFTFPPEPLGILCCSWKHPQFLQHFVTCPPELRRVQRVQGLEGLPVLYQSHHGWKGHLWTSLNSYLSLAVLFLWGNAFWFVNKFLETCIVFNFNLVNLLHKLDTKNSYTDNVW